MSGLPFSTLPRYFPASLLQRTKTATVSAIPFPPVSTYDLPECETMARMPMVGITFRDMYFVHEAYRSQSIHFHELVHVIQWRTLGFDEFLVTYGVGVIQQGYAQSPLEATAFALQAQFERGVQLPGISDLVVTSVLRARKSAIALFRAQNLMMGA